MKKFTLYAIATAGVLATSWSAAISINVTPTKKPVNVHHNYCKPGSTKTDGGYTHVCSSNGRWVRASRTNVKVKKPKVKVRAPSIGY